MEHFERLSGSIWDDALFSLSRLHTVEVDVDARGNLDHYSGDIPARTTFFWSYLVHSWYLLFHRKLPLHRLPYWFLQQS